MGLYKRGDTYWIDYRINGKRVREAVGTREEARVVLGTRIQSIRQGRHPELMKLSPTLFKDHAAEVLAQHYSKKRSVEWARIVIDKHLVPFFGERYLSEVTPLMVSQYMTRRREAGKSPGTVNNERAVLSKCMSLAVEWDKLARNPVAKVKKLENPKGRRAFPSAEEAALLIAKAPVHIKPVLIAMTETGGRKSEVLGLKWEDVALDRGVLYFSQTNTKNARQREIPLTALLADTLRELAKVKAIRGNAREYVFTRFGKPMRDIRTAFQKARERAGLGPEVTVHSLRRGFATLYASRSGDPYLLKELLGHQDLKTTQIYIGLSEAHRRAAVPMMGINGVPAQDGHKMVTPGQEAVR